LSREQAFGIKRVKKMGRNFKKREESIFYGLGVRISFTHFFGSSKSQGVRIERNPHTRNGFQSEFHDIHTVGAHDRSDPKSKSAYAFN